MSDKTGDEDRERERKGKQKLHLETGGKTGEQNQDSFPSIQEGLTISRERVSGNNQQQQAYSHLQQPNPLAQSSQLMASEDELEDPQHVSVSTSKGRPEVADELHKELLKKHKVALVDTPEEVVQILNVPVVVIIPKLKLHIENYEDVVNVIIVKNLTNTDIRRDANRLSIPFLQLNPDFLTREEHKNLHKRGVMEVKLIDPMGREYDLTMACWQMSSPLYVIRNWNEVVVNNNFQAGQRIVLLSVKEGEELHIYLLLPIQPPPN